MVGWGRFYQEPFYAYAVAMTYRVFGDDPRWVFAWQMALGVLSNLLIYLITRRYFDETTAVVAGVLAVLCSPLLYYEMVLVRETTISCVGLLLVYLTGIAFRRRGLMWWALLGAVMGFSLVVKSTFAVYVFGVLVALAISRVRQREWGQLAQAGGVLIAAIATMLVPLVARNLSVGVSPLTATSAGGIVFIGSNTPDYPPGGGFYMNPRYAAEIMADTQGRLGPSMVAAIATHPSMFSYAELIWNKSVCVVALVRGTEQQLLLLVPRILVGAEMDARDILPTGAAVTHGTLDRGRARQGQLAAGPAGVRVTARVADGPRDEPVPQAAGGSSDSLRRTDTGVVVPVDDERPHTCGRDRGSGRYDTWHVDRPPLRA